MNINSRRTGALLYADEAVRLLDTVQAAVRSGAYLRGADLSRAYLSGAYLRGADLSGADLSGAGLSWTSHDLLAELLKRAASNDIAKLRLAGLVLIKREWCWAEFLALDDPLKDWALGVLVQYVTPGCAAPEAVKMRASSKNEEDA